jgi:hypothetical protein
MDAEFEIYTGKTFGSLCQDIVKNSEEKKQQIDILITDLRQMIKTINDATMVVPMLKEYYDVSVRNDEQLIKLAAIIQRMISGKVGSDGDGGILLSDEEKKQLMSSIEDAAKVMSVKVPELDKSKISNKKE